MKEEQLMPIEDSYKKSLNSTEILSVVTGSVWKERCSLCGVEHDAMDLELDLRDNTQRCDPCLKALYASEKKEHIATRVCAALLSIAAYFLIMLLCQKNFDPLRAKIISGLFSGGFTLAVYTIRTCVRVMF